jgi:hypothetical protein
MRVDNFVPFTELSNLFENKNSFAAFAPTIFWFSGRGGIKEREGDLEMGRKIIVPLSLSHPWIHVF